MIEHDVAIGTLELDGGGQLPAVKQRVSVVGSGERSVLVAHALTGSSRVTEWWPGIAGERGLFDPAQWRIIGINVLGGCYGSTGPSNVADFPRITVGDMVRAQRAALDALGISHLDVVIGGSLGGMQALQWAFDAPERIGSAIVVGAHDHHTAMGVALNAVQRDAIDLDPVDGLRLARKLAILTYKSEALLRERHERRPDRSGAPRFDVEGYLELQADRFEQRMDAATYTALTHAMDSFDLRSRALPKQFPPLHFVGISSDWLFRPEDIDDAARRLRRLGAEATYAELVSDHGHDAFLAEPRELAALLDGYLMSIT